MQNEINVAAYVRYSSENQRDGYSIEAQKNAILDYCARNNYKLIKWFIDEALSARSDNREEFQNAIVESKKKSFDVLVVHKLDRFARNRYDSIFYRRKLKENGVRLESVLEKIDDNNPEDIILLSVLEGMNEYYSRNLSREVRKGLLAAAKQGKTTGGVTPYGYKANTTTKKLEVVESEAVIIRHIFEKFDSGFSMVEIAEWLKSIDVKSRHAGKSISSHGVQSILSNEKYIGRYVYNAYRNYNNMSNKQDKIVVEDAIEPIVTKDLFERVQRKLENASRGKYTRRKKHIYLLSGLIVDSKDNIHYTGKSMQKVKNGKDYDYSYYAKSTHANGSQRLPKEQFEKRIIDIIIKTVFSDDGLNILKPKIEMFLKSRQSPSNIEIEELKDEIKKSSIQLDRLLDLYLEGSLDKEQFKNKKSVLSERIDYFQTELDKKTSLDKFSVKDLITAYKKIGKLFELQGYESFQKNLIGRLISKIYVHEETFEIIFKLPVFEMSKSFMLKDTNGGEMGI